MKGYIICKYCGKKFEIDETEYEQCNGTYVCPKCTEEHTCYQCKKVVDKLFEDTDLMEYICQDCANENKINRLESLFL